MRKLTVVAEHRIEETLQALEAAFPRTVAVPLVRTQKFMTALRRSLERGWLLLDAEPSPLMCAVEFAMALYCKSTYQVQIVKAANGDRTYRLEIRWFGGGPDVDRGPEMKRVARWYRTAHGGQAVVSRRWRAVRWRGVPASVKLPTVNVLTVVLPEVGERSSLRGMVSMLDSDRGIGNRITVANVSLR